jgi:hypothetical protein
MSDNSSQSWNDNTERLLENIRMNCIKLEQFHREYYFRIKKVIIYFKLPIIIMSSLNAILAVSMGEYLPQQYISVTNCGLSFIIGTLTSVSLYLRIEDRLESSLSSSKEYHKLSIEIFKMLSLRKVDRSTDADQFLNDIYGNYVKLFEKSNLLTNEFIDELKKKVDELEIGISVKE